MARATLSANWRLLKVNDKSEGMIGNSKDENRDDGFDYVLLYYESATIAESIRFRIPHKHHGD